MTKLIPNEFQAPKIKAALEARPYLQELVDRLYSIGDGVPVIWHEDFNTEEWFITALLLFGRVSGKKARLRLMQTGRCHHNSEMLAIKYPRYQRETGFTLGHGCWRPHSWVFDSKENQVVETTVLRKAYFGLTLPITKTERDEAELIKKENHDR